ncbi:N-acetylglucosamine-6-phosphate deacetylase [Alkalibacillus salilacus]|uniref:N-acetylglucosamine-6-phosphate deacetylase n=1 Tax=Alkalibacillus salilacus TaxID=284582 RepID=A0ABT9VIX2_9BACI|nr:N-acetylglucosamine-6-phosphate deacetylase [Alkalibacillus salilacus]MDQ0160817.1 N-acetylglucosamine-6-phosphate deacetylase [Alkalibacillus salilacus]
MIINHVRIFLEKETIEDGSIEVQNGKIIGVHEEAIQDEEAINGRGLNMLPGFIDTHIHGANGVDVMDGTSEALKVMAQTLPREGTTSFLPTTLTSESSQIEQALKTVADYDQNKGEAEILGAHVEGPFINEQKKGAQPAEHIRLPDVTLVRKWLESGVVKTMTLAPELDGANDVMRLLNDHAVVASAGHTDADYQTIRLARTHGLSQLTHLCNAMNGIHHREVGAVGAAALLDDLQSELIADGIHVVDPMLKLLYDMLGPEKITLITDSIRAKGLDHGTYTLGGQDVTVANGQATLSDGTLAGSVLMMNEAVKRMMDVAGASIHDVIQMASVNPAKQYGVWNEKGSIAVGKDADFVLVDGELTVYATYCKGVKAYERD